MVINEKYSLKAVDTLNVVLYEHGTIQDAESSNFGKPTQSVVGYFPNIEKALNYMVDKELCETGLENLKVVYSAIKSLKEDIKNLNLEV